MRMGAGMKGLGPTGLFVTLLIIVAMGVASSSAQMEVTAVDERQTAIALEQAGKSTEAEATWRAFLKSQPASAEAYAHLGLLEARQEHYQKAIPLYRKALSLDPAMPGLRMNLGLALFKSGELKPAIETFNLLLKTQEASSSEAQRLRTLIGMADYGLRDFAAAVPYLKEATADDPQNLPFRLMLAHSCLASKQYQCVLDVYHEILTLNAESAEADMLAGEALDEMQDHAGAMQQFRAAVKANPNEPNVHFGLGYLLWTQGQYQEAAHEFQAELANVPDHVQAIVYLADTNIKMNHPDIAVPLLKKTIRLDQNVAMAHLDLGIVDGKNRNWSDALRELRLAAKLAPENVSVHWHLGKVYQAMGRTSEANAEFEKTKTLTKAADDSVFRQINKASVQSGHTEAFAPNGK